ncbi:ATP-binding protein [Streptomyces sp. NPDC060366]|uniref:ATP-binding protein n=1 Tax=Streptomyces sp. NPDC060366 TaxID=3347105 RepID=UPI003659EC84
MTMGAGHLIAVVGSSPGVGKSTLCRAVARRAAESGATVDHFEEADILSRPSFRPVAEEFAGGSGSVRPGTLVESTRDYVAKARAEGVDVLVTDALLPFIPSLVAWGHDETTIAAVLADLARAVRPTRVTVVYLRDDPDTALRRAVEREGPDWLDWYVGKLGAAPGTRSVKDLPSAAEHLRREEELTARLLAGTHWRVLRVDVGGRDAEQTERYVREILPDL